MKTHVEVCNQLRGEKRSLENAFHARLKEVGEDRSKLKSILTKENRLLQKSYNAEVQKQEQLEAKSARDDGKITNLKRANNQLMRDLLRERQVSNLIIDEAMVEARRLSAEALEMTSKAYEMRDNFEEQIITERNRVSARLHKERVHHSRESERLQQKQAMSIEKHQQEKASLVKEVQSKSDVKYHKVREHVAMVSKKLKEQHLIWQTRLCDIDSSSKNQLSKECEH